MKTFSRKGLPLAWLILLAVGLFLLRSLPGLAPAQAAPLSSLDAALVRKIEPTLLKEALHKTNKGQGEKLPFIVYLAEEADLGAAMAGAVHSAERRQAMVEALQATAERSQGGLRTYLAGQQARGKVESYASCWIFNGLAVRGDLDTLLALAARPEVKIIRADHKRYLEAQMNGAHTDSGHGFHGWLNGPSSRSLASSVEWNVSHIRADTVWNALGIDGAGVVVASLDSGVDWNHPALQTSYRGYDPGGSHQHDGNWYCATDEGYTYPHDGAGHGTHTTGTMVGGGDPAIGVAPGARWMAAKIFNDQGVAYDSWIHAGFQWALDPDGNPATDDAPQVVNNSWGSAYGGDATFRPDVQALLAAGILPVCSAGNDGPGRHTINSPASYPEALAVAALDEADYVAIFSSLGPSPWGEVKPEISAPGVKIRSSVPNGGYAKAEGTSMAAPHVAGVAALLLQANPHLAVADLEQIILNTALPLGVSIPDNETGWGRVDAYNAAASVAHVGFVVGTVTDAADNAPLADVTVRAESVAHGGLWAQTVTDDQGRYLLTLAPGIYDLTTTAFYYQTAIANSLSVTTGMTVTQSFALSPLPGGTVVGRVTEAGSGAPLSATILVQDTSAKTTTDPGTGYWSLAVPAGTYSLRVESEGHRVGYAAGVSVTVNQTSAQDFVLSTAPRILVVDSGAWSTDSEIGYFQQALDDLDYLYHTHTIRDLSETGDVPTADDLRPYDVVIWSSPTDSPGYVRAWEALAEYLDGGGRLFLSGQDVGYWDGGGNLVFFSPQYGQYLKAKYLSDDSGSRSVEGVAGDIFDGLSLSIEGHDGANNQSSPDEITAKDADYAASVITYEDGGGGGQRVGRCSPYRAVYLAFGFEAIAEENTRRQVMERVIDWLMSPGQMAGLELSPQSQTEVGLPGESVAHTLRLWNTGQTSAQDIYRLEISGHTWPTMLSANSLLLASCVSTTVQLQVQVPLGTGWHRPDTTVLTVRSSLSPTLVATSSLTTKTPAPVLLVDDDRWYDQEERYKAALDAHAIPYDSWTVNEGLWPWETPSLDLLQNYPLVVWFTAYDWHETLTAEDESKLATYLDSGGRLFFSGQDYLYTNKLTSFGKNYLGIEDYYEDISTTLAIGNAANPVGYGLGPYNLLYPFDRASDVLIPDLPGAIAFWGSHGKAIGLTHVTPAYRTVFFSFPFEALLPEGCEEVMERVIGWLSWLGTSTWTVDKPTVTSGDYLNYDLVLHNDGWETVSANLSDTLPGQVEYVEGSLSGGASYQPATRSITWAGTIAPGDSRAFAFRVAVHAPLPFGTTFTNTVRIGYDNHHIYFDKSLKTRVNAPDFSTSSLTVDQPTANPGDSRRYTIVLSNTGVINASSATLQNSFPRFTEYVSGSLSVSNGGPISLTAEGLNWTGPVTIGQPLTVAYDLLVVPPVRGLTIDNVAYIRDDYGETVKLAASVEVPYPRFLLPVIFKGEAP